MEFFFLDQGYIMFLSADKMEIKINSVSKKQPLKVALMCEFRFFTKFLTVLDRIPKRRVELSHELPTYNENEKS